MTAHRAVLLLFGFLHLAVACAAPAAERPGYREPAAAPLPGTVTQPPSPSLTYVYEKPPSAAFHGLFDTLRDSRILEAWVGYVNAVLRPLPRSIVAAFAECGEANSRYEPDPHRIVLCYEEAERSFGLLKRAGYAGETQLLTAWIGSLLHQLYHELGHALVNILALPVLGREEDGADQFATIALLGHPQGWHLVLGAADYFNELSAIETARGLDPARLHPYFSQRYYNMLCLAYGSDPSRHQDLVERGRLPQRRAESCRVEYLRAASGWGTLLDAYGR